METGSRADASNITNFAPAFFVRFRPNTAMDMVNRLPGFSFDGGSGARGFSGTGGNVLIDGERPPSRGDSLSSIISRIPASGVERIEIIRGGAEGIDMQGRPIIANIVRREGGGVSGTARAWTDIGEAGNVSGGGSLQLRRQTDNQLLEGEIELRSSESASEDRRWRLAPDGGVLLIGNKNGGSQTDRLKLAGAWEGEALGGRLRVNGLGVVEAYDRASLDRLLIPGGEQESLGGNDKTEGEVGLRYSRKASDGAALEVIAFQSFENKEGWSSYATPDFTSGNTDTSKSGESILRATLDLPQSGDWAFDGGAEGVLNFSESSDARSYNGQPFDLDGDKNRIEELRGEVFGTATWSPLSNLSLESALRYEWSRIDAAVGGATSEKELSYLKPRMNISWSPEDGHQIGVQLERSVGQLDFGGFASSASFDESIFGVGNPDIEPEKFWTIDARYERQFGGQNSLVISYGHRDIEDQLGRTVIVIPPTTPGASPSYYETTQNLDTGEREWLGVDATVELDNVGMPGGILGLGVDKTDSSLIDPVTNEQRAFSGQRDWGWNVSLQQTLADGDVRWSVSANDGADTRSYSPRSISDSHGGPYVAASLTWKPRPGWTLGASANNLVAEDWSEQRVFYDAPRNVGDVAYTEHRTAEGFRSLHLSVRRDF